MSVPTLKLADNHQIPQIGLGLWQVKDQDQFNIAFETALAAGYRHFDTAQAYRNESMLGQALKKSNIAREEIFITTKIAVTNFGYNSVKESFLKSLENLQTDYVDLLLLHFPVTIVRKKAWKALEELNENGTARSIGVSNYTQRHLEEMKEYANYMPVVNQVELHIFLQQHELLEYCKQHDIVVEAYSPLAHAHKMDNQVIADIAKKHHKSYAQVMLRWLVQQGVVLIPKSVTPSRIEENIAIFDFNLTDQDRAALTKEDKNLRTCWSPVHVP